MSDLRNRMERLGDRALVEQGAFERLERRRTRKVRNRKIGAGVLALVLTVGGSVAAFSAFHGGDEPRIGSVEGGQGFFALWPETTLEGVEAAQEAAITGDPDLQWRLDATSTVEVFAEEVLLLSDYTITPAEVSDPGNVPYPVFLRISTPQPSCPAPADGQPVCGPSEFVVTLSRPLGVSLGDGGVWSVIAVASPELSLADHIGAEVVPGETWLELPTSLPDGQLVSAGSATTDACQTASETVVEVTDGLVRFRLLDGLTDCDGYLYLMYPATAAGEVPVGQFMFGTGSVIQAEPSYHVQAMAAVPVRFGRVDALDGPVPDVTRVTCDGADITVETPVVRVQPDGFHITVMNQGEDDLSFSVFQDLGGTAEGDGDVAVETGQGGGVNAPPGESSSVWALPPGMYSLSCSPTPEEGEAGVAGIGSLEVVDPDGLYVPAELECDGGAYGSSGDYFEGTAGFEGDPLQVARDHVSGIEYDDTVERAGYPESEQPVIRIVRGGAVVGKVTLRDDGQGGWLNETVEGCTGTLFGWSEDITGVSGPMGETGGGSSGDPGTGSSSACAVEAGGNNVHMGADVHIDQENVEFDTACLVMPTGEPLTILFSNLDDGVPSNISIHPMTPCLTESLSEATPPGCPAEELDSPIFVGETITGVSEIVYEFGPLEPGSYYFMDDVHPMSRGVLLVQ